jgi:topoisomerase-4 subunit A
MLLKAGLLAVLDCVRDESNKDAAVRLVFEPKSRAVEQQDLTSVLLAQTSLETSASVNLTMIGADGRPTLKSLRQIINEWLGYRQQTVQRRTQHRLTRVLDRIHVLEGRYLVLLNIDEVIRIIRNADEPKPALIERFKLSDRQAEDILEIRLRQLARLEAIKIEQELKSLREEEVRLAAILGDAAVLKRLVVKEIEADAKQYGDARRTLIQTEKRATTEVKIVDEAVTVVVSAKGWVRALKGHELDKAALAFKSGDQLYGTFACRSVDPLIIFGTNGRVYSVPVALLPGGRGDGQPITTMIELEAGSQIAHFHAGSAQQGLVLAGSGGYGLIAQVGDLVGRQKAGKTFLTLEGDEQALAPAPAPEHASAQLACLSSAGRLLTYPLDELKHQPKGGRGLTLMDLDKGETLLSVAAFIQALRVLGSGRGAKPKDELFKGVALASYAGRRARKGRQVEGMQKVFKLLAP